MSADLDIPVMADFLTASLGDSKPGGAAETIELWTDGPHNGIGVRLKSRPNDPWRGAIKKGDGSWEVGDITSRDGREFLTGREKIDGDSPVSLFSSLTRRVTVARVCFHEDKLQRVEDLKAEARARNGTKEFRASGWTHQKQQLDDARVCAESAAGTTKDERFLAVTFASDGAGGGSWKSGDTTFPDAITAASSVAISIVGERLTVDYDKFHDKRADAAAERESIRLAALPTPEEIEKREKAMPADEAFFAPIAAHLAQNLPNMRFGHGPIEIGGAPYAALVFQTSDHSWCVVRGDTSLGMSGSSEPNAIEFGSKRTISEDMDARSVISTVARIATATYLHEKVEPVGGSLMLFEPEDTVLADAALAARRAVPTTDIQVTVPSGPARRFTVEGVPFAERSGEWSSQGRALGNSAQTTVSVVIDAVSEASSKRIAEDYAAPAASLAAPPLATGVGTPDLAQAVFS